MAAATLQDNPLDGHSRYELISNLNRGRHGVVVLAHDKIENERVAIKFLERPTAANKYVEREIINQYKLCHPHVIRLLDVFLLPSHLALVLEYADMGDLHSYVMRRQGLSEGEARWFFQQIVLALDFCNRMGVANRDVKLENLLLATGGAGPGSSPFVKLADFGFSKDVEHQSAPTTRVGTVMYMAPEVLGSAPGDTYDASKADVWSLGVVLYAMLSGKYPFKRSEDTTLSPTQAIRAALQRILSVDYPVPERVSPEAAQMVQSLLQQDPTKRPSIAEVMEFPFYKQDLAPAVIGYNESVVKATKEQLEAGDDEVFLHVLKVLRELLSCSMPLNGDTM